jgi:AcrR family transcriptional regulator
MTRPRTSKSVTAAAARGPGRPRSEAAHSAILAAAIAMVREVGYDATTMDGIAERAGVGKATLYRRWPSKEPLIADALEGIARSFPVPDSGSTRDDLLTVLRGSLGMYRDPATRGLLSGLVAAMARSPMIADAMRGGFLAARTQLMRTVLQRGVARGELRADADLAVAIDLLRGPLLMRGLLSGDPLDEPFVRAVLDVVMRGLAPDARRAARPRSH